MVTTEEYLKKLEGYSKDSGLKIPDNIIPIDGDTSGNFKYTFDKDDPNSMYKDPLLKNTARAYYFERDGLNFENDTELVDYFINDRTWKQANSYSIGKELIYATSDSTSFDQKRRLKFLTEYWGNLPNFWQDGGRGFIDGLVSNLSRGVVDPTNIIAPGVGSQVIKQVAKKGGSYALTKAVAAGTGTQAGVDAVIGSSVDAMVQKTERELGLSQRFDLQRNFTVATLSGGASIVPGLPTSYFAAKGAIASETLDKAFEATKRKVFDYADPVKNNTQKVYGIKGNVDDMISRSKKVDEILQNLSDNPTDTITRKLNAYYKDKPEDRGTLKLTTKEIKKLKKKDKRIDPLFLRDPGDFAYSSLRMLAASSTRGESAIKYKMVLPVVADRSKNGKPTSIIVKGGYEEANVDPYINIIKPVDDYKLLGVFNDYIQAKRSQSLNAQGIKTSMKTADIRLAIKKFNALKGEERKVVRESFDQHKLFSQALLELQRRTGIISTKQMMQIMKENPIYAPFYVKTKDAIKKGIKEKKVVKAPTDRKTPTALEGEAPTQIVGGVKGPARLEITGSDLEIAPIHESMMNYTFHAYKASETNLAKLKVYDEIDQLEILTKGKFKASEIYRPVTKVKNVQAITKDIIKKVRHEAEESGIKLNRNLERALEGKDSIKVASFADTIKTKAIDGSDAIVDVVYKNGKLKMYQIVDPAYMDMFKSMGGVTNKYLKNLIYGNNLRGGLLGKIGEVSRVFPQLITHSPPFIAFNFVRDTLAGSINSAFGFNAYGFAPGLSTAKGLFKTFKAPKDMFNSVVKNVKSDGAFKGFLKGMKEAFALNQNYQRALNAGMGFASRKDSERIITKLTANIKNSPAKNKKAYLDSLNFLKSIKYYGVEAGKAYGQLVNRIEYASRLAEFEYAKKVGASDLVAGFLGREISTDFGMHGSSSALQAYNRVTMFFNAGLQGFYRGVVRRAGENKGKFAAGVTATLVAPEILLWTLTNETPEYEELDDDIKLLNYVIPIYEDQKADGSHLRPDGTRRIKTFFLVPKPYDFGVFPNIARGILEAIQEGDPGIAFKYAQHSFAKILPGLATPTLVSPVVDLIRNKNYKNNEIQPYYQTVGQYRDQLVKTNTRFTSEQIAKGINDIYRELFSIKQQNPFEGRISPITVDYILNSYFVGLAEYPLDVADAVMAWDEDAFGPRPTARLDESDVSRSIFSIVTRRFFAKVPTKYNKNLSKLYDLKKEAEKTKTSLESASNDLYKLFRNKMNIDVDKLTSDKLRSAIRVSDMLSDGLVAIKKLRERRNIIPLQKINPATGMTFTADEKRAEIDRILTIENELAYNLMRDLKESADPYVFMSLFGNKTFKTYANKNIKTKAFQKVVAGYFK